METCLTLRHAARLPQDRYRGRKHVGHDSAGPVSRSNPAQTERARRLLEHESAAAAGAGTTSSDPRTAASRVYDRLHEQMAPLVGVAGVQLLFVRSAKLAKGEFAWLSGISILEGSAKLRERLQAQDPAVSSESAVNLFGTFFALVTTLIGERLTTQILRGAWPTIADAALTETDQ